MVMVAVPTNFSEAIVAFDASVVEGVLAQVAAECPNAVTVIRSTMQPGVTSALAAAKRLSRVLYCPEFLREGRSLDDCLHPDRLVIGADDPSIAEEYRTTVEDVYASNGVPMPPVVLCSTQEAEVPSSPPTPILPYALRSSTSSIRSRAIAVSMRGRSSRVTSTDATSIRATLPTSDSPILS